MGFGETMAHMALSLIGSKAFKAITEKKDPPEAERVGKEAAHEREGVFTAILDSTFTRMFPRLSALKELSNATGLTDSGPEASEWQNEIDTFLAVARFIPDRWLEYATDYIVQLPGFMTVVDHWPLLDPIGTVGIGKLSTDIVHRVRAGEPTAVIDFLRIVSKDFAAGKVTAEQIGEWIGLGNQSAPNPSS